MRLGGLLLFFAILVAWAAGVRVHPEVLPSLFQESKAEGYQKLELDQGNFFVGRVLREDAEKVVFDMGTSEMEFLKSEIVRISEITPEEIESGVYDDWIFKAPRKSLVTYEPEKNLLTMIPGTGGKKEEARTKSGGGSFFPDISPAGRIQTAQIVKNRVLDMRSKMEKKYEDLGVAQDARK
ncbi:MAG: hypothetical protein JW893_00595 [Candidatus Omnitrophica bacterium]|nr:hypothetical protein [Candidatus Omnitrophota bacterium]